MADIYSGIKSSVTRGGAKIGGLTKGLTKAITSITDPVQELLGVKGELYTIGYIGLREEAGVKDIFRGGLIGDLRKTYYNALSAIQRNELGFFGIDELRSAQQNGITIDGFFRFEGEMGVDLPTYPIQYQTDINMHRIRTPDTVAMEVFVSAYGSDDIVSDTIREVRNNNLVSLFAGEDGNTARVRRKLDEFRWLMQVGRPFTLYTPHCIYENMVLAKIRPKNDEQTMDGWSGVLEFKEMIYYTDSNDSQSRVSKRPLSAQANSVVSKFKSLIADFS